MALGYAPTPLVIPLDFRRRRGYDASMNNNRPIIHLRCCRSWPIDSRYPYGPCGLCGQVPTVDPER